MKHKALIVAMAVCSFQLLAATDKEQLQLEVQRLKQQTQALQSQIEHLNRKINQTTKRQNTHLAQATKTSSNTRVLASNSTSKRTPTPAEPIHSSAVTVHAFDEHPESLGFYPTALIADHQVVTYIAGTPIVASPFLGSRPAFDGSDYIVNISSINRDVRLMQQRRRMYHAYEALGYPAPDLPIIALSGAVVPSGSIGRTYFRNTTSDWTLGTSEMDVAAALNNMVEGYMALAYDDTPPLANRQRVSNASVFLNMGFVNIGNLDKSPFYFTAGQLFVPFGRFSSAMISAPLTMMLARTKERPFILGYKSQTSTGPFAAIYGFKGDTTLGGSGVGGINWGYVFGRGDVSGEVGAGVMSSINDSSGMQFTGSVPGTTFGGFASITNGNEAVKKIPTVDVHGNISIDRYNFTAEWVGTTRRFRPQDLSFNGRGASPQAAQLEAGVTFMAFNKPSSLALGYQWSKNALALNIPKQRINGVFNTSIWKDTVESIEFRHDIDYKSNQFANGAAPAGVTNVNTVGTGKSADTLLAQIGVYF
ncbi:LbtU family siderophore porin [Legionella yabuuchiae]|uniref:LbtU family siderophore porin n=1 Tax=Legionella yabuuchiae TaxID=376727 RepID=UPI0010565C8A|nr:LbtU family siderophore porin [Legionella yabuuchiae]